MSQPTPVAICARHRNSLLVIFGLTFFSLLPVVAVVQPPDRPPRLFSPERLADFFKAFKALHQSLPSDAVPDTASSHPDANPVSILGDIIQKQNLTAKANATVHLFGFTSIKQWTDFGNLLANTALFFSLGQTARQLEEQEHNLPDEQSRNKLKILVQQLRSKATTLQPPSSLSDADKKFVQDNASQIIDMFNKATTPENAEP